MQKCTGLVCWACVTVSGLSGRLHDVPETSAPTHLEVAYSPPVPGQLLAVVVHQTHVTEYVGPALTHLQQHSTAQQGVTSPNLQAPI